MSAFDFAFSAHVSSFLCGGVGDLWVSFTLSSSYCELTSFFTRSSLSCLKVTVPCAPGDH